MAGMMNKQDIINKIGELSGGSMIDKEGLPHPYQSRGCGNYEWAYFAPYGGERYICYQEGYTGAVRNVFKIHLLPQNPPTSTGQIELGQWKGNQYKSMESLPTEFVEARLNELRFVRFVPHGQCEVLPHKTYDKIMQGYSSNLTVVPGTECEARMIAYNYGANAYNILSKIFKDNVEVLDDTNWLTGGQGKRVYHKYRFIMPDHSIVIRFIIGYFDNNSVFHQGFMWMSGTGKPPKEVEYIDVNLTPGTTPPPPPPPPPPPECEDVHKKQEVKMAGMMNKQDIINKIGELSGGRRRI